MVDKWRWAVFRGEINETNYNEKWWQMRFVMTKKTHACSFMWSWSGSLNLPKFGE
jgi:hypothetical protein